MTCFVRLRVVLLMLAFIVWVELAVGYLSSDHVFQGLMLTVFMYSCTVSLHQCNGRLGGSYYECNHDHSKRCVFLCFEVMS